MRWMTPRSMASYMRMKCYHEAYSACRIKYYALYSCNFADPLFLGIDTIMNISFRAPCHLKLAIIQESVIYLYLQLLLPCTGVTKLDSVPSSAIVSDFRVARDGEEGKRNGGWNLKVSAA